MAIQFKRGTAARLTALNPILNSGEPCIETDTGDMKIGDGVSAWSALRWYSPPRYAVKTTDTARNTTATPADDLTLSLPIVAGGVYELSALLAYSGASAADMLIGFTVPASTTLFWTPDAVIQTTASQTGAIQRPRLTITSTAQLGSVASGLSPVVATPQGLLTVGTSGAVTVKWSQAVSDAADTIMATGSYLKLTRIAS